MYKRIDFTQLEGFPITQNSLAYLQDSYQNCFSGLGMLLGDYVIVSGVTDLGANYSDGWVAINGELLPFIGGVKSAQIIIEETAIGKEFADGTVKDVWFTRIARCGVSGGIAVGTFARLTTIKQMLSEVNGKVNKSGDVMTGNLIVPNATANNHAVNYGQLLSIINGAPGALDTLYELAAALGNDSNFSTTVFNLINGKVSKSGDTMTGNLTIPNAISSGHALNKGQLDAAVSAIESALGSKANKAQSAWTNLSLLSGWQNWTNNLKWRSDEFGKIHLSGNITAALAGSSTIALLPVGSRPTIDNLRFNIVANTGSSFIPAILLVEVGTGAIEIQAYNTSYRYSINGISFWTDEA